MECYSEHSLTEKILSQFSTKVVKALRLVLTPISLIELSEIFPLAAPPLREKRSAISISAKEAFPFFKRENLKGFLLVQQ